MIYLSSWGLYSMPTLCDSTDGSLVIIFLRANIFIWVNKSIFYFLSLVHHTQVDFLFYFYTFVCKYQDILMEWDDTCVFAIMNGVGLNLKVALVCISLIVKYLKNFLWCFSSIWISSIEKSLFGSIQHFFNCIICYFGI